MGQHKGRVTEIRYDLSGQMEAFIACPITAVPHPGQYLLASDPDDPATVLGVPVFNAGQSEGGFWVAPGIPRSWKPGTNLDLVGPLGHGFDLPANIQRLGLVALGETVARLMPLVRQFAALHTAMTLFTDLPLPQAPAVLEAYPLASIEEALDWPDFLVLDLPLEGVPGLRNILRLPERSSLACPAQVLVTTPMPCCGVAQCGVCALPASRGFKFACEDGPVLDLKLLKW